MPARWARAVQSWTLAMHGSLREIDRRTVFAWFLTDACTERDRRLRLENKERKGSGRSPTSSAGFSEEAKDRKLD